METIQTIIQSGHDVTPSFPEVFRTARLRHCQDRAQVFEILLVLNGAIHMDPFELCNFDKSTFNILIEYGANYEDINFSWLRIEIDEKIRMFRNKAEEWNDKKLCQMIEKKGKELHTSFFNFLPDSYDKIIGPIVFHFLCDPIPDYYYGEWWDLDYVSSENEDYRCLDYAEYDLYNY